MKVLALEAENIKKLKLVNLNLGGEHLKVSGKPGEGKTTLIDLLWMALGGKKTGPKPVQDGEESASITVKIGDDLERELSITRKYKSDGSSNIKIRSSDGRKVTAGTVKSLLDSISFDPMEFYSSSEKERTEILLRAVGIDFQKENLQRQEYFQEREQAGRSARAAEEEAGHRPELVERVDVSELNDTLTKIQEGNSKKQEFKRKAKNLFEKIQRLEDEKEQANKRIKEIDEELVELTHKGVKAKNWLENNPEQDASEIIRKITDAETINDRAREYEAWLVLDTKAKNYRERYTELSKKIDKIDQEKKDKLKNVDLPLPELDISPDGIILYKNQPLVQGGESAMIQTAFAISSKLNPILKVCRIDGAESLGKEGRENLLKIAQKYDMQVFMSRVRDGDAEEGEITIEEGMVR